MNEKEDKITKRSTFSQFLYSIIWELPFDNYHKYYKTGIVQKMSKEEKKMLFINDNKKQLQTKFFKRIITLRPNILDDSDMIDLNRVKNNIKNIRYVLLSLFFLNSSFFGYKVMILKYRKINSFIYINLLLMTIFAFTNFYSNYYFKNLHEKYRNIIDDDEVVNTFKKVYNID
jgi:hypothetical protein